MFIPFPFRKHSKVIFDIEFGSLILSNHRGVSILTGTPTYVKSPFFSRTTNHHEPPRKMLVIYYDQLHWNTSKNNGQFPHDFDTVTMSKKLTLHILPILKSRRMGECVAIGVNRCAGAARLGRSSANFATQSSALNKLVFGLLYVSVR